LYVKILALSCGVSSFFCELRITEQLLVSLGMFAHDCGSLKDCNAVLSDYGPDSMKERERIVVIKDQTTTKYL